MLPPIVARQVADGVRAFLASQFRISTPGFSGMVERFVDDPDTVARDLVKGPYLGLGLPFLPGQTDPRRIFPGLDLLFPPYAHQEKAFARLVAPRFAPTLVATGTGSGKTECYMYPILAHCLERSGEPGIKAILVYPMNALATDQARRFARAIWQGPLKGRARVGLYVGGHEREGAAVMGKEQVITIRDVLRREPPDILMTNYKMLDYLLIRPEDAPLWRNNGPETLRFLVVDELHTFDGAQGADLACLIRRLKDRLKVPKGHLACVGTSATLGGTGDHEDAESMLRFASAVFDAAFEVDALIGEERMDAGRFLSGSFVAARPAPPAAALDALDPSAYPNAGAYLAAQAELWLGLSSSDPANDAAFRLGLGEELKTLPSFQNLLRLAADRLSTIDELVDSSHRWLGAEAVADPATDRRYRRLLVESLLALVAFARRPARDEDRDDWREKLARGEEVGLAPLLQLRVQVWMRELRRMVATIAAEPRLEHADDVDDARERGALPVVHCRECGATGWLAARQHASDTTLKPGLQDIYGRFFAYDPLTVVLYPADGAPVLSGMSWKICTTCRRLNPDSAERCQGCQGEALVRVVEPEIRRARQGASGPRQEASHDCPQCGSREGLTILGVQATSLGAVVAAALFASPYQDDKKLIAFSDSVQDAAHRAGFWSARTWRTTFRTALAQAIAAGAGPGLDRATETCIRAWRDRFGELGFVTRFMPNDMMWLNDWRQLIETGSLPDGSDLPDLVARRLDWEVTAEFGFSGAFGATLENVGLAAVQPDPERFRAAVRDVHVRLTNEFEELRRIDERFAGRLLAGVLRGLRRQGGIHHEVLQSYLRNDGRSYLVGHQEGREKFMPRLGRRSPAPRFLATGRGRAGNFEVPGDKRSWFARWIRRLLIEELTLVAPDDALPGRIAEVLLAAGTAHGLLRAETTLSGLTVYGLRRDALHLTRETAPVACSRCACRLHAAAGELPWLEGSACPCPDRDGAWRPAAPRRGYWHDLYGKGEIERIYAAEHTGLLDRDARTRLESRFVDGGVGWAENLLSATSTLEMGIDIGDLSSVMLASIPPEQANYVQRVGRAGRRDGNALIAAIANARPHDRVFWRAPEAMIAGPVRAPGVFLDASAILYRQVTGFTLDRWVAGGIGREALPRELGPVLEALAKDPRDLDRFPFTWLGFIEKHRTEIVEDFVGLFADELSAESRDRIRAFVEGGTAQGGLGWRILDELEGELKRRKSLQNERRTVRERLKTKRAEPESERRDQEIDELEREERLLTDLIRSIRQRHLLEFLTDRGLIANYAFPEEGVTLKSFIWWRRDEKDDGQGRRYQSRTYEYGRPAHVALTELAPNAVFYAEGRRVRITRVDLTSGRGEAWRLCPSCSHAELADLAERRASCPSCDDPSWSDAAALQTMLRLSSVIAATNDRESRIGDERDDREPTLHEVRTYIEHAPEMREETYVVDDEGFAFGFEFLRRATFRQVNFGPRDPNTSLRVDGEAIFARPFSVCGSCGQVQPDGPGSARDPAHARSCRHHDTPDGAPLVPLRLYRDLDSEALRILMPSSAIGDTDWISLIAAIERGLVEYYRGDVGHLRATLKESLEPGQTFRRRYLYLYDGVPGGTGYLKQLMQSADELKRLLELARDVVRDCGCDDGCHACLFSYRLSWRLDRVSRRAALALLDAILARWDKLRSSTEGLDQLKNNALFESELEAMFVEALRRCRAADGTPFLVRKDILPSGKAGYYVGAGRGRWYLEPQAWVGPKGNTCRADFLLMPASGTGLRIAVFTDGFEFHRDRIAKDLLQRQAIWRTGDTLVWSLSWNDVQAALADLPETPSPNPLVERLATTDPTTIGRMAKLFEVDDFPGREQEGAFAWLARWLETSAAGLADKRRQWTRWAMFRAMLHARKADEQLRAQWSKAAGGILPPLVAGSSGALAARSLLAACRLPDDPEGPGLRWLVAAGFKSAPDPEALFLGIALEQPKGTSAKALLPWWRAFLRLATLAQFLPDAIVVDDRGLAAGAYANLLRGVEEAGARAEVTEPLPAAADAWNALATELDPHLLAALCAAGVPVPEVDAIGLDLVGADGAVVAQAEVAWPDRRIALVGDPLDPEDLARLALPWSIMTVGEAIYEPRVLGEAFARSPEVVA